MRVIYQFPGCCRIGYDVSWPPSELLTFADSHQLICCFPLVLPYRLGWLSYKSFDLGSALRQTFWEDCQIQGWCSSLYPWTWCRSIRHMISILGFGMKERDVMLTLLFLTGGVGENLCRQHTNNLYVRVYDRWMLAMTVFMQGDYMSKYSFIQWPAKQISCC
jgi:hypothetical protein